MATAEVKHVDEAALDNHLPSRMNYLKSFVNFTDEDGAAINVLYTILGPGIPMVVDAVYNHLLEYDITAAPFLTHHATKPGAPTPQDIFKSYTVKLLRNCDWSDDSNFWDWLDKLGVMHTGRPTFKHREKKPALRIELLHLSLLLGYFEDGVLQAVLDADNVDAATKRKVLVAFNKLLWIQNDLFSRHYVADALVHNSGWKGLMSGNYAAIFLGVVACFLGTWAVLSG
jgi:hypothetical protein